MRVRSSKIVVSAGVFKGTSGVYVILDEDTGGPLYVGVTRARSPIERLAGSGVHTEGRQDDQLRQKLGDCLDDMKLRMVHFPLGENIYDSVEQALQQKLINKGYALLSEVRGVTDSQQAQHIADEIIRELGL